MTLILASLFACTQQQATTAAETRWIENIDVSISEAIPSVVEVRFSTAAAGSAWVEYGTAGPDERTTLPDAVGEDHAFAVIAPPLSALYLRAVVEVDGERFESGTFQYTSGQLLPSTPFLNVTVNNYSAPEGAVLLLSVFDVPSHTMMVDLSGEVLWSLTLPETDRNGLGIWPTDGHILANSFGGDWEDPQLQRIDLSGNVVDTLSTPGAHHFFTADPAEALVWIETDEVDDPQLGTLVGDALIRQTADGKRDTFFSTWDHLTFDASLVPDDSSTDSYDWTHANWIDYSADRDSYLMSTAHTNVILEIDREGEPLRTIGGMGALDSDYTFADPETAFAYPHGAHWTASGDLLVFSTRDGLSEVIRYTIDEERQMLTASWSYGADLHQEAMVLGEAQELDDGNILISWGSVGLVQIVSPAGELLWEMSAPLGNFFSQIHMLDSPYDGK